MNHENKELLKKWLREEAAHYDQHTFGRVSRLAISKPTLEQPLCGVRCCMAGVIAAKTAPQMFLEWLRGEPNVEKIRIHAVEFLGIDGATSCVLFGFADSWPEQFEELYCNAETPAHRVEAACSYLDDLESRDDLPFAGW